MLRQTDAQVFKKYSQMKLQMKREALAKLNRKASESDSSSDTEELACRGFDTVLIRFRVLGQDKRLVLEAKMLIQKIENVVARDGIEPPTPAFSGPPTELAKWSGISGCD